MFVALAGLLFSGFPVAMVIGGVALIFGLVGAGFGVFAPTEFFNFLPRIWGGAADNLVLIAAPLFIFMGVLLEKSRVASDLLRCLQLLLRRVPGGLALGVALMGTIMAATTGIIGASIVMLCMLSLPVMLQQGYDKGLATGVIAASGTLGILIPPSIMLVIMGDLMQISTGKLFLGAMIPGLLLSALYLVYIVVICWAKPRLAPPMPADDLAISSAADHPDRPGARLHLPRLGHAHRGRRGGRGRRRAAGAGLRAALLVAGERVGAFLHAHHRHGVPGDPGRHLLLVRVPLAGRR
jgi:TRAP-type mannitol/chloroaromatic compound transport system permease large subunit